MKSRITSLIIIVVTSGCWATIPIPYLQFGIRTPQQYFYPAPQRQFSPQPFYPNYEMFRYPQMYSPPQFYPQPQPLVPSQPYTPAQPYPYTFYNTPQPLSRDVALPLPDHHEPTLQYYRRQLSVQPLIAYDKRPTFLQRPVFQDIPADCDKMKNLVTESGSKVTKTQAMSQEVRRTSEDSEANMVNVKTIISELPLKLPSFDQRITPEEPVILLETPAEEAATQSLNSEKQSTTEKSDIPTETISDDAVLQLRILEVEPTSMESTNSETENPRVDVPTKFSESKKSMQTVKENSISEMGKAASASTKTASTEKTMSQEAQDVAIEPTLNKESDAMPVTGGTANE